MAARITSSRKHRINEYALDFIDTESKAYFLGYFYADGNVSLEGNIQLTSKDVDIVPKLSNIFDTDYPIREYNDYYRMIFWSPRLVQTLQGYGIVPNKTYNHTIPVYIPPEPLTRHFYRGLIDGDGCICLNERKSWFCKVNGKKYGPYYYPHASLSFVNRNKSLVQSFKDFIGKGTVKEITNSKGTYEWRFGEATVKSCFPILTKLYQDTCIYLDRKYGKYLRIAEIIRQKA